MRKAALFYNPQSGRRRERRESVVQQILAILRDRFEVSATPTLGPAETPGQVRSAMSEGCSTIIACGGDGTIHDIVQALACTDVELGIIPLGTGNTLAHDLRLPLRPEPAARALLKAKPRRVTIGHVNYTDFSGTPRSRFFTVTVGVGVDAHLFYKLNPMAKGRLGMAAYYVKATHLWLTHPLEYFSAEFQQEGKQRQDKVSQVLAVRIRYFGGVLRELAPGASLDRDDLRLVLFRTRSRIAYLRYIVRGLAGRLWSIPGIELLSSKQISCQLLPETGQPKRVFVEADGELLGVVPAEISTVPDALTVLVP